MDTQDTQGPLKRFLFPRLTRRFLLRAAGVAALAYCFFTYVCVPIRTVGISMEPTCRDGAFNLCWKPTFWFRAPARQDIVAARFAGNRILLLKRVVAVAGDTVEFRNGRLFLNKALADEPYVAGPCDWNLEPRKIGDGRVYLIGDNRTMAIDDHMFGELIADRIVGKALL